MGVKISELPSTSSANTNDSLVLNHGSETSRITLQALMESYLSGAGLVTDEELAESLQDYVAESEMAGYLSGYVTDTDLDSRLSDYVLGSVLSSKIGRAHV